MTTRPLSCHYRSGEKYRSLSGRSPEAEMVSILKEAAMFGHPRDWETALGLYALAPAAPLAIFPLPGVLGTKAV